MRGAKFLGSLLAACTVLLVMPANATLVVLCGPNICYEYNDDVGANAGITLFTAPTLLGGSDTLEFTPTAFSASTSSFGPAGPNLVTTTATFQFTRIWAPSGAEIGLMTLTESGDYRIVNGGYVGATVRVQVLDKTNQGIGPFPEQIVDIQAWSTSTPTSFLPPGPIITKNWSLTSTWNAAALMVDPAYVIDLQIQNTLDAMTFDEDQLAFIQKKLTLVTTIVPVPPAALLLGSAVGLLGWVRRRAA